VNDNDENTPIAKDTRTAILDAAQDMVQRQSIRVVRFQELAKRTGIKKAVCIITSKVKMIYRSLC
jgi:AcrR family transcriptional regulator